MKNRASSLRTASLPGARATGTLRGKSRGVASVEMALMAPVLILFLLGMIDLSRAAVVAIRVVSAASVAAQYGAQGPGAAVQEDAILAVAQEDSGLDSLTVTTTSFCKCSDGSASTCQATDCASSRLVEYIQVDAQAPWQPVFAYPGIPTTVNLSSTAIVQVIE